MLTRSQTKDAAIFDRNVHIIRGDIGYLREIDGKPLDALAFPTHSGLTNNGIGAAAAVHRRTGPQLDAYLKSGFVGTYSRQTGEVVVTPAFNASGGLSKLIHCVGPRVSQHDCLKLLERTYESLMGAIQQEDLKCVAVASISTGNMGVSATDGAQVAMRVVCEFLRKQQQQQRKSRGQWDGAIAFVCYEQSVFDAFQDEKRSALASYRVL
ncbi:hypothetical protein Gpo141_00014866, partial [Globisporangium polare]